jgi:hypothetical protein
MKMDTFRLKIRTQAKNVIARLRKTTFMLLKMYPFAMDADSSVFDWNYLLCALYSAKHWQQLEAELEFITQHAFE